MFQMLHHAVSVVGRACTLGCCAEHRTESPSFYVTVHKNATSFLKAVGPWLRADEEVANTILPLSEALSRFERGETHTFDSIQRTSTEPTIWISCWSHSTFQSESQGGNLATSPYNNRPSNQFEPQLGFLVVSSTSHLGSMPVFLFSPKANNDLAADDSLLTLGMRDVVAKMAEAVPPERIYSTFGRASLASAFAAAWETQTGQTRLPVPWKRARMFYCTSQIAVADIQITAEESATWKVRIVEEGDISTVADVCHRFSLENSPSPLMLEESHVHASHLVITRQGWVCEIQEDQPSVSGANSAHSGRIVSFCEVGRRSQNVAVITKIFTVPEYRQRGYGTQLLSEVMQSLFSEGISSVVVYPAAGMIFANCIFIRLGFKKFDHGEWIEWGFDGAGVSYW